MKPSSHWGSHSFGTPQAMAFPRLRARSAPERLPHLAKGLGDATLSSLTNRAGVVDIFLSTL